MIIIQQNHDGTYTLFAGGLSMIFDDYQEARDFVHDYADNEIKFIEL